MPLSITPLTPVLGAEVTGIDVGRLSDADFAAVEAAFEDCSVLVIRDQHGIDDAKQAAFSRRFGDLETTISANPGGEGTHVAIFSNLNADGTLIPPKDKRMVFNAGNQMWHSDSSFKPVPAKASILSGRVVPPEGGETEFASGRAAWDALSPQERAEYEPLVAIHDFLYSRGLIDKTLLGEKDRAELPAVRQKLVRTNPVNGRKALYAGAHASHIEGRDVAESRALLRRLTELVTRPEHCYIHRWREGDLVVWDNRAVLHRGRPWDEARYPRVMHRTTVAGTGPSVEDGKPLAA
jgi:alpha-ketoglutarate-dependent 2,4-dichlorophenoxyacetate dioxygenase